jgi:hypothetical protein
MFSASKVFNGVKQYFGLKAKGFCNTISQQLSDQFNSPRSTKLHPLATAAAIFTAPPPGVTVEPERVASA